MTTKQFKVPMGVFAALTTRRTELFEITKGQIRSGAIEITIDTACELIDLVKAGMIREARVELALRTAQDELRHLRGQIKGVLTRIDSINENLGNADNG